MRGAVKGREDRVEFELGLRARRGARGSEIEGVRGFRRRGGVSCSAATAEENCRRSVANDFSSAVKADLSSATRRSLAAIACRSSACLYRQFYHTLPTHRSANVSGADPFGVPGPGAGSPSSRIPRDDRRSALSRELRSSRSRLLRAAAVGEKELDGEYEILLRLFWCRFSRGVICSRGLGPFGGVGIESLLPLELSLESELFARCTGVVAVVVSMPRPIGVDDGPFAAAPGMPDEPAAAVPLLPLDGFESAECRGADAV